MNNSICISLVIPSTNITWSKCKYQVEYMICNSVELPKEVIIVISSSSFEKKEEYNTYCKYKIFLYYRKKGKNSASNKNYGSKYAKCSHISYFDADDIMSRNRIKILHYIIKHYFRYDIILHMYTNKYKFLIENKNTLYNISKYFYLNSSYITSLYRKYIHLNKVKLWGCCHFLPKQYHVSNGWITIKRKMFKYERFNEDISIQRAEDSEYNGRVIVKGYKALVLRIILGYYAKQNECNIII